jgi:4-amino-4-deoxy-L-arabinose transferase-like glycosyltransferase
MLQSTRPLDRFIPLRYLVPLLCLVVYAGTFFFPLMDKDAAHHANIALNMYEHNDYVNLIDRGTDYLDKPHLLFWVSAISFKIFGVTTFAHRFPAFLFSLLAVFSTYRLAKHLAGRYTAQLAAIILATAQSFIMAIMDARMETPLTAFIIAATWQLIVYVDKRKLSSLFFAALCMALAFSTKGWIGPVVIFIPVFFYLVLQRKLAVLINPRTWLFIPLFALFISPVLYAYYLQYDLHPEKIIRGTSHHSGVRFILWDQLFERSSGFDQGGQGRNSDYFFLYHTFLWAFLPWSIAAYAAVFFWIRRMVYQKRWRTQFGFAAAGFAFILFVISFSKFKMPHYIIMLFPMAALFTAPYLRFVLTRVKAQRFYTVFQTCFAVLVLLITLALNFYFFPPQNVFVWIIGSLLVAVFVALLVKRRAVFPAKFWYLSVAISILLNFMLNFIFFPQVMKYQGGNELAKEFLQNGSIPDSSIILLETQAHSFDFYTGHNHAIVPPEDFTARYPSIKNNYFLLTLPFRDYLIKQGFTVEPVMQKPDYNVSTIKMKFLNPATRPQTLDTLMLVKVYQR